jgi:hypothetical protein
VKIKILYAVMILIVIAGTLGIAACSSSGTGHVKVENVLEGGYTGQEVTMRGQLIYETLFFSSSPLYMNFGDDTGIVNAKCGDPLPESNTPITIRAVVRSDSGSIYLDIKSWNR